MHDAPHQLWVLWLIAVGSVPFGLAGAPLGPAIGADRLGSTALAAVGLVGALVGLRRLDGRVRRPPVPPAHSSTRSPTFSGRRS